MIQLGANRSSQKAVNGQESLLFMGNPDYVASSVEFPKVPIIDLNKVQKSHTPSNGKMKLLKQRKTLGDNNIGMLEETKTTKIKRSGTSVNPFAMTFGAIGEEEAHKAKGRKSLKNKKKRQRMSSGEQQYIVSERDQRKKPLLESSAPDIGIHIDEFGTPIPEGRHTKIQSKTPNVSKKDITAFPYNESEEPLHS